MKECFNLLIFLSLSHITFGQDTAAEVKKDFFRHRFSVMMAFSHIPSANDLDGQNRVFIVPTWGINYDFWFSPKFGLGLHNDLVLQQYKIEKQDDNTVVERSFPIGVTLVGLYKPNSKWTFLLGAGREFEKNENFNLISGGIEYGIELQNAWEVNLNLIYESKLKAYDSWLIGVGFSKFFDARGN